MPQGIVKKSKAKSAPASTGKRGKGKRAIPPKRAVLVRQAAITKKHSSALTGRTERSLAEKAGHLEMLPLGEKKKAQKAGKVVESRG